MFLTQKLDYYRCLHSIKTAIACLIGIYITKCFAIASGQWIPITTIVVMSAQKYFGSALRKAYMRLLGTVVGIIIAIFTLSCFGNNLTAMLIIIGITCMVFTYIASGGGNISYAGTLGAVTLVLVLTGPQPSIHLALQRGSHIIIGIIIALGVSRFVFPIHARDLLLNNLANTLRNLQLLYVKAWHPNPLVEFIDSELEGAIASNLQEQPKMINDAVIGSKLFAKKKAFFYEILNTEHKLRRLIILLYKCLCETDSKATQQQLEALKDLHHIINSALLNLAECCTTHTIPTTIDWHRAISKLQQPPDQEPRRLIAEHSMFFFIEHILKELATLQVLVSNLNT